MKHKKKFISKNVGAGLVSAQKERGITLIALVITIIVLLILAGVTIAMVVGDNGILTRAKGAKESTRGGEVKEIVEEAVAENAMADQIGGNKNTKESVVNKLHNDGKLTDDEFSKLETVDEITIGSILVDFSKLNGLKAISTEESFVGCYADIEGDGKVDGIIYADLAVGKTPKNQNWRR